MQNDGISLREALAATGGPWSPVDEFLASAAPPRMRGRVTSHGRVILEPDDQSQRPWNRFRQGKLYADLTDGRRVLHGERVSCDWSRKEAVVLPPEFLSLANWEFIELPIGLSIRVHTDRGLAVDYINLVVKPAVNLMVKPPVPSRSSGGQRRHGDKQLRLKVAISNYKTELAVMANDTVRARFLAEKVGCSESMARKTIGPEFQKKRVSSRKH